MDFLQAAALFTPAFTGLAMTIYDKDPEVLKNFEKKYCFCAGLQSAFTASELASFSELREKAYIYEIIDPMEVHLVIFWAKESWVLLGPFVESKWNEKKDRQLLASHGADAGTFFSCKMYYCQLPIQQGNYVARMALFLLDNSTESENFREIRTVYTHKRQGNPRLIPQEAYEDIAIVNRRYHMEEQFIEAISAGETKKALVLLRELEKLSAGLRFVSENMKDQIAGAAIVRTVIRMGAERGGLAPVVIDSISQEYAQQMQHTVSAEKLGRLLEKMVIQVCGVIREEHKNNYSVYVKKAIDYIGLNLSRQITVTELSEVSGITQSYFVKIFGKETGMTVKQYMAKKRCEAAAELLLDSKLSVQQVGAYVGYADNNYFSKVFKANMGASPQDYRKKYNFY